MKVLVQRVTYGSVTVNGRLISQIAQGFVVLLGITHQDTTAEADWLAEKVAGLRIFEDEQEKMNLSLLDVGGSALVISQFTLYGDTRKGKRPSFTNAARPETAEPLVNYFVEQLKKRGVPVVTGIFAANMQVTIHNDGPVTLMLEKEKS